MSDESDLEDVIKDNATGVKKAKGDNGELENHSLKDQIDADKYLCSKKASKAKNKGLGFSQFVPPGSV